MASYASQDRPISPPLRAAPLALFHTALRRGCLGRNSWVPTGSNALEPHRARSETFPNSRLLVPAAVTCWAGGG